jgi:hypothetical protein
MRFWLKAVIGLATIGVLVSSVFYLFALEPLRASLSQWNAPSCGSLAVALATTGGSTVTQITQAGTCFQEALIACRAATLKVSFYSVDTGTRFTFVVEPPMGLIHSCALADVWQFYRVSGNFTRSGTERCSGMTVLADSFEVYGCGAEGTITVP